MLLRRRSHPLLTASKLIWPALALGALTVALQRRARSRAPAPMPRLPVRRKPSLPSSSRLRRLSAPPAAVMPPGTFWDADPDHLEEDDPAEIPVPSSPLVSEASQSAAGVAPGAFYDARLQLRW